MVVFFDIDDTLVDHRAAMEAAALNLRGIACPSVSPGTFVDTWRAAHGRYSPRFASGELSYEATARARMRDVVDPRLSDDEADRLFHIYLAAYESRWALLPDVLSGLDRLRFLRLGIISNGRADEQRRKLVSLGIADRFELTLVSEDCGYGKPSPVIFRRACDVMHVTPRDAVYVGDEYELDACAARAAGLVGIWLDRFGITSAHHAGPIITSLTELTNHVRAG